MFGLVQEIPQRETTPFYPRSPYGAAKVYGHWITVNYREAYGLYACSGILFNHESPIRGETFVTRKITRGLARISEGMEKCLYLGNMDSLRDWGHARDYVRAQWLMLQQEQPEDFVIATGEQHSVRDFVALGRRRTRHARGVAGKGDRRAGSRYKIGARCSQGRSPAISGPPKSRPLLGDPSKAHAKLGWKPEHTFQDLVREMVASDLEIARRDAVIAREGFKTYRYSE